MANPASRQQLIDYCLRRLGAPVIDINVDPEQLEDRVDDALKFYQDYHFDGTERIFMKHQITAEDKVNQYITIPEAVTGVIRILPIGNNLSTGGIFNIRYQLHLNDLFDFSSASYINYRMAMTHVESLQEIFVGQQPIRFHRHRNTLNIDMDWRDDVAEGEYIVIECYRILDPETYSDVYGDRWLREYTTQLFKRQWGENLKKFEGMTLPGGLQFNGQQIYNEAQEEISRLETEVTTGYGGLLMDMIG